MGKKNSVRSKVSIIILNYNGKDIISKCISSCFKSNFPKTNLEVVVIDNNSSDGSYEFIKKNFPKVRIIKMQKNLGTASYNIAIRKTNGDFLFLLNNDDVLDPNCINHLISTLKTSSEAGLCKPKGLNLDYKTKVIASGSWVSRSFYCGLIRKIVKPERIIEIPYAGNVLIKREILDELGYLFDSDYFLYGEDLDLGLRVRLIGKKILYDPKAVMYHGESPTAKREFPLSHLVFLTERNLLVTFFKNTGTLRLFLYFPYVFGMRVFTVLRDIILLRPINSFARIRAMLWIITNTGAIAKKRTETQRTRKAKDSYVFQIFSEKEMFGFM